MTKNDLQLNEKRWRSKRLFRKKRIHPMLRFVAILVVLIVLAILAWWFEMIPLNFSVQEATS